MGLNGPQFLALATISIALRFISSGAVAELLRFYQSAAELLFQEKQIYSENIQV
jgi:hypothetical protein